MKPITFFAFTAFCMALNASATYSIAIPHSAAPDSLPPALPLNFDSEDQLFKIKSKNLVIIDIVADPEDPTNRVLQLKGTDFEVKFVTLKLGTPVDVITASLITMRIHAPQAGITVSLQLFNDLGRAITKSTSTIASGWQKIQFDLSGKIGVFNEIGLKMIYFDPDTATIFFDDIAVAKPTDPALPLNFESEDQVFTSPTSVSYTRVADPQNSGDAVLRVVHAGTDADESGFLDLGTPVDLSTKPEISLRLHAPRAGIPVQLGFENFSSGVVPIPSAQATTTRSGWQELRFDLGAKPGVYRRMLLSIDFDTARADTFFVDDIAQRIPVDPITLPVNFENGIVKANDFFNNKKERITTTVISNPQSNDDNPSTTVAQIAIEGRHTLVISTLGLNVPIAFDNKTGIQVKVYAPKANTPFTLGLSSGDINTRIERKDSTVTDNAWEELVFDFAGDIKDDYNQISFVWRNQTEDLTFLIDDIEVVEIVYDATLKDLRVAGKTIAGFNRDTLVYTFGPLPSGTTIVPKVTATPTDANANTTVTAATALPGTTSVVVTSADSSETKTYTVAFTVMPLGLAQEVGFVGYPNPVTDILTLQLADGKTLGTYSLLVTDASGRSREVQLTQEGSSIKLDVRPLASGLYFIRLRHKKEEFILRFIKR